MNTSKTSILESSGLDISLEYISIGKGNPKTLVLSGIHGDERSGQLVIANLLKNFPRFSGTLNILPIANPLAYAMKQRNEPISGQDLNRSFTGKNDGRPIFQIADVVAKMAKEHDYVFDLHGYTTAGLIQAGIRAGDGSIKMAEVLNPDVLRISHITQEYKIDGAISNILRNESVSYLLIEMPTDKRITTDQVERVANGIIDHLLECSRYNTMAGSKISTRHFVRIKLIKALTSGVFERNTTLELGKKISKDDELGILTNLPSTQQTTITSPYDGIICEMELEKICVVVAGETLFGVGELISDEEKWQLLRN